MTSATKNLILCEIHAFVPSFEDCLLFRLHGRVSIHRDGIVGKVEEGHFQREQNVLKLSEASYETFLKFPLRLALQDIEFSDSLNFCTALFFLL